MNVMYHRDAPLNDLGGGSTRRVLAHTDALMLVEVSFETGSAGAVHAHPHSQNSYVLSGRFRFQLGDEFVEVGAGDSLAVPPNLPHGTLCLEKGTLLDVFTPVREDFL